MQTTDMGHQFHSLEAGASSSNATLLSGAAIRPQTVQDPLNTGLMQSLHTVGTPPGLQDRGGWLTLERLQGFVEQEILAHFDLIQPVHAVTGQGERDLQITSLCSWEAVLAVLKKLAYDAKAICPWSRLGLGAFEGPDPSEVVIQARAETARLLCEHASSLTWPASDLENAAHCASAFADARRACLAQLADVLRERKKLKAGKLPLWKELGHKALSLINETRLDVGEQ